MSDRTTCRAILLAAACMAALWLAGCASGQAAPPAATLAPFDDDATPNCVQSEIWPTITDVQPAVLTPGSEVSLSGRGGYIKDSCGGYIEAARTYPIYLDEEPAGELLCYVDRCEGKFKLPENAGVGKHCLAVQKGTCQMELEVTGG